MSKISNNNFRLFKLITFWSPLEQTKVKCTSRAQRKEILLFHVGLKSKVSLAIGDKANSGEKIEVKDSIIIYEFDPIDDFSDEKSSKHYVFFWLSFALRKNFDAHSVFLEFVPAWNDRTGQDRAKYVFEIM